ncbi:MAG TPA: hypothetical protein VKU61_05245, partial [Candidatus Binatia bacterium]|nr:hypothetical protein [Candidatus Binatia bacterium]
MTNPNGAIYASRMRAKMFLLLLLVVTATGVGAADTVRTEAVGLRFTVPAGWTRVPAASDVRAAQWRIPQPASSDSQEGDLVLFFFGKGKGGTAQENLDRWYAQVTEPDGRPSRDAGVVTIRTVNGLRVTSLDLPGTYRPIPAGGGGAEPRPGFRLLAAIIEG